MDPFNFQTTINIRQNPSKQIIIPYRGNIYDRNGELFVSSIKHFQIDIDRNIIFHDCKKNKEKNISDVFEKISDIISRNTDLGKNEILQKLNRKPQNTSIFISENITESRLVLIKKEFQKEGIRGLVQNFSKLKRSYPKNDLAVRLLGMVRKKRQDNSGNSKSIYTVEGITGIESTYNNELKGIYGWEEKIIDAKNKKIPFLFLKKRAAVNGNSLILTIDCNFQEILEENLKIGLEKYKAKNAIGIIMGAETGEIIAMSGISKNDKNKSAASLRSLPNLPVSFLFEPGSTMKPITALLAIENNIYKPEDKINCRNYRIGNRIITDAHEHDYKTLSFKDIIALSSNVGISRIVEKIGSKLLYDRMIELGFGQKTGSNLYGETTGIFRKLKDWQGYSLHSISFGQEISVTALQLARAYCAFANGGKILQPYILKEIRDDSGKVVQSFKPKVLRKISDKRSLDTLKDFLKGVVDHGTAKSLKMDYLEIAGKTGTGEKAVNGVYSEDKYTSIFAGFFPVDKPEYVMVILFDEADYESYSYYATLSAVPTFRNIVNKLINLPQTDIIVDVKERDRNYIVMPDLNGLDRMQASELLAKKNILFNIIEKNRSGVVINQFPKPDVSFDQKEIVQIIIDVPKLKHKHKIDYKMPDLVGLTIRRALSETNRKKIKLIVQGRGIIKSQSIPPGNETNFGEKCLVTAN